VDKEKERLQKKYNDYVKQVTPTHNLWWNTAKAFVTGGIICCIGQFILNVCENYGLDQKTSGSWCSMLLILLSVLLTGLNLYPSIANWGGAGALVPITGFANGARHRVPERRTGFRNWLQDLYDCRTSHFIRNIFKLGARIDLLGIKMVGNGVVPFPCGSGRRKMSSQTRNIVIFGSERGKTLFQTREVDEKKEKEEKKEATRVWKRKNVLPDPKYCDFRV